MANHVVRSPSRNNELHVHFILCLSCLIFYAIIVIVKNIMIYKNIKSIYLVQSIADHAGHGPSLRGPYNLKPYQFHKNVRRQILHLPYKILKPALPLYKHPK